jgi:hypothetical protein
MKWMSVVFRVAMGKGSGSGSVANKRNAMCLLMWSNEQNGNENNMTPMMNGNVAYDNMMSGVI